MHKFWIFIVVLCFGSLLRAQTDTELWLSPGVKYSVTKKLDVYGVLNLRMEPVVLNTLFPEFSMKYKVAKWFSPSFDYRMVWERNKFGNYKYSNRVNLNANFETTWKRFEFGLRGRLQSSLSRVSTPESSFSDIAPGFRLKPSVLYDIDNSITSPTVAYEMFFENNTDLGIINNKNRLAVGCDFETLGDYSVSLKYLYGFSTNSPKYEHIISFSFTQKYKSDKAKKKDDTKKK